MEVETQDNYTISELKSHIMTANFAFQSKQRPYLVISEDNKLALCNSKNVFIYDLITDHIYSTDLFYPHSTIFKSVYALNGNAETTVYPISTSLTSL